MQRRPRALKLGSMSLGMIDGLAEARDDKGAGEVPLIKLDSFLKLVQVAEGGGHAKEIITSGEASADSCNY